MSNKVSSKSGGIEGSGAVVKNEQGDSPDSLFKDIFIGGMESPKKIGTGTLSEDDFCGFDICCSQKIAQKFATKQGFMIIFSIIAVVQGMSYTYYSSTLSTLEKRLKITSEVASEF
jgi:hypothetical protein